MVIKSQGTTFVDMTDSKKLSVFLGANIPQTQIYDPNDGSYTPDWSPLVITPVVYANDTLIALSDTGLSITYKRKEGIGAEGDLMTGETVSGNVLTVAANKLADVASGILTYIATATYLDADLTESIQKTVQIEFAKVTLGVNGTEGTDGTSAVTFKLYTTSSTTFVNGAGTIEIKSQAYVGDAEITVGATYEWYKYSGVSGWGSVISTDSTYMVDGSTVDGIASFKCEMSYGDVIYTDVITLTDKTDNYQSESISTGGSMFKNGIGTSCLYANLYQNSIQIDMLKSSVISDTAPSNASAGAFYYKITSGSHQTTLMKFNGTTWQEASGSDLHTQQYNWYRRDKDGNIVEADGGLPFATGKVIYVTNNDVDVKTTFICESVVASSQVTIYDIKDIWVTDTEPVGAPDGTIIYIPSSNVFEQYDASSGRWKVVTDQDTLSGNVDDTNLNLQDLEDQTVNNQAYKDLILNTTNANILLDLIAKSPFLLDTLLDALTVETTAGKGTTLKSLVAPTDCSVFIGQDEIKLQKNLIAFMTLSALKATLPPSVTVGSAAIGSKLGLGNFTFEHQSNGNLTLRKV